MIARKIMIGMIVSTEYLQQIRTIWDVQLMESELARTITGWCWEYFERYNKAPGREIEGIFFSKLRGNKISKTRAEEIEQDILPRLNDEYISETFNLTYLLDETRKYFRDRRLDIHAETIQSLRIDGNIDEAERTACEYKPLINSTETDLNLSSDEVADRVRIAFEANDTSVIVYPGKLGVFWNSQFVKGALVAFLAPEKRGKTFMLLDIAMRACAQGRKVVFIQAGDLSEAQLLRRISIWLAHKSDRSRYCKEHFQTVPDCILNQFDQCTKKDRMCEFGVFTDGDPFDEQKKIQLHDLVAAYEDYPDYMPCTNCDDYNDPTYHIGTPWITLIKETEPLIAEEAQRRIHDFFVKKKRNFRISTHPNDTLTIAQIRAMLSIWEKVDDFIPDVILVDYADLLVPEIKADFRHQQNSIWKGLRRLSQEKGQPLVITATQADANSYTQERLKLINFSEDKRKYAHATAFYGLNQDPGGREKELGILRINELILREDDYNTRREIKVLQNLSRGRPYIGAYY